MEQYFGSMQAEQQITSEMRVPVAEWPPLLKALGLHTVENGAHMLASSTLHTVEQQVAIIMKLEQAGKQGRISVRSTLAEVSQNLAQIAATYLLLPPKS